MNFTVNNEHNFQTNSSVKSTNTRNTHLLHKSNASFHVLREMHYLPASEFSTVYHVVSQVLRMKGTTYSSNNKIFKHTFIYSVHKFLMYTDDP